MNYQVIIADDEYFIRQKLKKIIPWESLQLTFAGEAENGLEVIELISNTPCDILLLDNRMPKMDGLKALSILREKYPSLSVIIISGYNDFEYARTAIRYGVTDYLLKPVDIQNLIHSLKHCIASISRRQNQEMLYSKLMHYERCTLLSNIRNGIVPTQSIFELDSSLQDYTHSLYLGAYIQDDTAHRADDFTHLLKNHQIYCEYTKESDFITVYQLFFKDHSNSSKIGSILTDFLEHTPCYVFLSIGKLFPLLDEWKPYYKRCVFLLHHRFFTPESNMVLEHTPQPSQNYSKEIPGILQNIRLYLSSQNEKDFTAYMEELFTTIAHRKCVDFLQLVITELFLHYHMQDSTKQTSTQNINQFIQGLFDEEHDLLSLMDICLVKGLECIRESETIPSDAALSKRIISYIQQNYADQELSVAGLAEVFQLNASYMGNLFKNVNNLSILQFITQTRMEAATELLQTGAYKISEIADMIGYSDVFYFSKRFKKSFGYSPKDYASMI